MPPRLEPLPLDFQFTARDTPALRARIERDLAKVTAAIRGADPAARAIFLTGGFSRGEGSAAGDRPLNDYDLVVARAAPWGGGARYGALAGALERELGLHVDLHPIWTGRLRFVSPKIFWFDTAHGARAIAGDASLLERLPKFAPARIPPQEAARLLSNRAVGLLEALPAPGEKPDAELVNRQASKALLACLEARLVLDRRYRPTYRERLALAPSPAFEWATRYKLDPPAHARADLEPLWREARDALLTGLADALPRAGWGTVVDYPTRARFAPVETAWGLLHGARPRLNPSHAARALALRALEASEFPEGPTLTARVRRALALVDEGPERGVLPALMRARSRTLQ